MDERPSRGGNKFRAAFVAFTCIALCAATVWARAGGGGGFHGGGGGGGGHGGGGGGGGDLIFDLIWLLIVHPVIGVPVLIVVIVFVYFVNKQGTSAYQSGIIRSGGPLIGENRKQQVVAQLRQHDPAFDEAAFLKRVSSAFDQIQTAWCNQNLKNVQLFLSDGVAERFALQFAEQRAMGYHDQMSQIGIDDIRIADLDTSGVFDEISVRIAAHASDFRAPLTSSTPGQSVPAPPRLLPDTSTNPFTEVWSFLRRRGTLTDNSKPGLIEGHCPNCGAAIEMNQNAQCPYCHALLHSGQYDWVVSEITQESEWERPSDRPVPGLANFQQRDASFDGQALEDRASVIFWRRASADRLGKIDPIRKVATDEFCDTIKAEVVGSAGQPRTYAGECAVGGVELLALIPARDGQSEADGMDRAVVRVRWSGKVFTLDATRQHITPGADLLRATALILARKTTARTDPDKSISSAHCPNCGSPESDSASNACPNCGTVLNDGSRDWVLTAWTSMNSPEATALLHEAAASSPAQTTVAPEIPSNAVGLLSWAIKMATADGRIDDRERAQLNALAAHSDIAPTQIDTWVAAAARGELQPSEPHSPDEARRWLVELAKIAMADGILDRNESALLKTLGGRAGVSDLDIDLLIKRTQTEQYQAARTARNSAKL